MKSRKHVEFSRAETIIGSLLLLIAVATSLRILHWHIFQEKHDVVTPFCNVHNFKTHEISSRKHVKKGDFSATRKKTERVRYILTHFVA